MNEITGARHFFIPKNVDYCATQGMMKAETIGWKPLVEAIRKAREAGWAFYAVNQTRGRCYHRAKMVTIPVWALVKSPSYKAWYIAHEVAHIIAGSKANHGPEFMAALKGICDPNAIHHELGYKPMHAKNAGIYDTSEI